MIYKQNNILIADYGLQTVLRVSETGEYLNSFDVSAITSKGEFLPHDVTTDEENYVYIADRGASKSIQVFTPDGKHVKTWPQIKDKFDPLSVRFLTEKLLLVPNYKDSKLYLFDIKARHLETLGKYGKRPGEFLHITNLTADKKCYIYTVEEDGNRVQKLDFSRIVERNSRKIGQ